MKYCRFVMIAMFVVLADVLTKHLIRSYTVIGYRNPLTSWLSIVHTTNTGAGFGILQNSNLLLTFVTLVVLIGVIHYRSEFHKHYLVEYGAGLVFAGGFGNLYDRIAYGAVTDFIAIGWWPVFNVADTAVCIGVFLLLVYYWKYD